MLIISIHSLNRSRIPFCVQRTNIFEFMIFVTLLIDMIHYIERIVEINAKKELQKIQ